MRASRKITVNPVNSFGDFEFATSVESLRQSVRILGGRRSPSASIHSVDSCWGESSTHVVRTPPIGSGSSRPGWLVALRPGRVFTPRFEREDELQIFAGNGIDTQSLPLLAREHGPTIGRQPRQRRRDFH